MTFALKVKKAPERWRCVRRYGWMNAETQLTRTCTRTRNFSELFLSCFLSLLSLWNGSNGTRKMSKGQLLVVGESLNSCGKLYKHRSYSDVKVASLVLWKSILWTWKKRKSWKQIENVSTALLLSFRRTIESDNYIHEWTLISSLYV